MRIDKPQFNHNGGDLAFGPGGTLYVSVGDGGNADDQGAGTTSRAGTARAWRRASLGKILRIDPPGPNSANGQYGIPLQATRSWTPGGADEIWAYGFRNPYRMSFDRSTGRLFVADVGQNDIEEVDVVRTRRDYGWPIKEGSFLFDNGGAGRLRHREQPRCPGRPDRPDRTVRPHRARRRPLRNVQRPRHLQRHRDRRRLRLLRTNRTGSAARTSPVTTRASSHAGRAACGDP